MTSLILPRADTAMMNLFLEHVATTFAQYFIVMQVDQAGWHQAKDLKVPENIRLIAQPAYSPERESTSNICGNTCGKSSSPISPVPPLRRSLTSSVKGSHNWNQNLNSCVP
jgi:hypothetical protein